MQLIILQRSVNRQNFQPYAAKNFAANAANAANAAKNFATIGCMHLQLIFSSGDGGWEKEN